MSKIVICAGEINKIPPAQFWVADPVRAVCCVLALCHEVTAVGINVLIGVHIGEVHMMDDENSGVTHELRDNTLVALFSRVSDVFTAALMFQAVNTAYN